MPTGNIRMSEGYHTQLLGNVFETPSKKRRRFDTSEDHGTSGKDAIGLPLAVPYEDQKVSGSTQWWQQSPSLRNKVDLLHTSTPETRKGEIKALYRAYSRLRSCLPSKKSANSGTATSVEEAFYALLDASKGSASVRIIAAELISRYAVQCPSALQAAGTVLLQLCNLAATELAQQTGDSSGEGAMPARAAHAAFQALPAFVEAAAAARAARALSPLLCATIARQVALFLLWQLHGYPLLVAASGGGAAAHLPMPFVGTGGCLAGQPGAVAGLAATAALRALQMHPEVVLGACIEALRAADPQQRREGLHFLLQATLPVLPPAQPAQKPEAAPPAPDGPQSGNREGQAEAADELRGEKKGDAVKEAEVEQEQEAENESEAAEDSTRQLRSLASKAMEGRPDAQRWLIGALQQLRRTVAPDVLLIAMPRLQALQQTLRSQASTRGDSTPTTGSLSDLDMFGSEGDDSVRLWSRDMAGAGSVLAEPIQQRRVPAWVAGSGEEPPQQQQEQVGGSREGREPMSAEKGLSSGAWARSSPWKSAEGNEPQPQQQGVDGRLWMEGEEEAEDVGPTSCHLWVGGLGGEVSEGVLRAEAEKHGAVERAALLGRARDAAVLDLCTIRDAVKVRAAFQGNLSWGHKLRFRFLPPPLGATATAPANSAHPGEAASLWVGRVASQSAKEELLRELEAANLPQPVLVTVLVSVSTLLLEFGSPEDTIRALRRIREIRRTPGVAQGSTAMPAVTQPSPSTATPPPSLSPLVVQPATESGTVVPPSPKGGTPGSSGTHRNLWVGRIDPSVREEEILTAFSQFGELTGWKFLRHSSCCFLDFLSAEAAATARARLNGTRFGALAVHVEFKHPHPSGQGQPTSHAAAAPSPSLPLGIRPPPPLAPLGVRLLGSVTPLGTLLGNLTGKPGGNPVKPRAGGRGGIGEGFPSSERDKLPTNTLWLGLPEGGGAGDLSNASEAELRTFFTMAAGGLGTVTRVRSARTSRGPCRFIEFDRVEAAAAALRQVALSGRLGPNVQLEYSNSALSLQQNDHLPPPPPPLPAPLEQQGPAALEEIRRRAWEYQQQHPGPRPGVFVPPRGAGGEWDRPPEGVGTGLASATAVGGVYPEDQGDVGYERAPPAWGSQVRSPSSNTYPTPDRGEVPATRKTPQMDRSQIGAASRPQLPPSPALLAPLPIPKGRPPPSGGAIWQSPTPVAGVFAALARPASKNPRSQGGVQSDHLLHLQPPSSSPQIMPDHIRNLPHPVSHLRSGQGGTESARASLASALANATALAGSKCLAPLPQTFPLPPPPSHHGFPPPPPPIEPPPPPPPPSLPPPPLPAQQPPPPPPPPQSPPPAPVPPSAPPAPEPDPPSGRPSASITAGGPPLPPPSPKQHWLCKSGVQYCTIRAENADASLARYDRPPAEPIGWPERLDVTKRADFRAVQGTYEATPPNQREVCRLFASAGEENAQGFLQFVAYLKQRDRAGVVRIPPGGSLWPRMLYVLPWSPQACDMIGATHNPSNCLLGLVLPCLPSPPAPGRPLS